MITITDTGTNIDILYADPYSNEYLIPKGYALKKLKSGMIRIESPTGQSSLEIGWHNVDSPVVASQQELYDYLATYNIPNNIKGYQDFIVSDPAGTNTFVCTDLTLTVNVRVEVQNAVLMFGDLTSVVGNIVTTVLTYPLNTMVRVWA